MITKYITNSFRATLKFFNIAVILGILFGLAFVALFILKHKYLDYGAYNIALLDLRAYLNEYLLIFLALAFGVLILDIVVNILFKKVLPKNYQGNSPNINIASALSYSLVLAFILAVIAFSMYTEIIWYLQSTSIADKLHQFTESRSETFRIFVAVFAVSGILFVALCTYILSKYNLALRIQSFFTRIGDSKPLLILGPALLGLLIIINLAILAYENANSPSGPNIILISIDTLRADHMSTYGYERNTTPNLDKLAQKGILFENAYSQGAWTFPSMASMHTSLYPTQVGVNNLYTKINDNFMTLAEYMKNNFYNTYAAVSNVVVSKPLGFAQGFDKFNEDAILDFDDITSHLITDQAIEYLNELKGQKFFLWLHYMDPHFKYVHHPKYNYSKGYTGELKEKMSNEYLNEIKDSLNERDIQFIKDLYDEEIAFTDENIGRLLKVVDDLGLMNDTVIIVTSDHGEEFLERKRFGHGKTLHQELIHVPLILYVPNNKNTQGLRVKSSVEIRDIAKTLLDLSGNASFQLCTKNLLISAEEQDPESYAYSQRPDGMNELPMEDAIVSDNWKLIKKYRKSEYELYDLKSDPGERENIFSGEDNQVVETREKLYTDLNNIKKDRIGEPGEVEFNQEDIRKLKALGYIE